MSSPECRAVIRRPRRCRGRGSLKRDRRHRARRDQYRVTSGAPGSVESLVIAVVERDRRGRYRRASRAIAVSSSRNRVWRRRCALAAQ
jgi:hypothetical protein